MRITPAHAGKTFFDNVNRKGYQDHPRACGENIYLENGNSASQGSPPRMRGKRKQTALNARKAGITPAHAGKTAYTLGGGYEV